MNTTVEQIPALSMDYREYAPHFDSLCNINPAYMELVELFREALATMNLPDVPTVVDLGAGTGNFICALLDTIQNVAAVHVDCSTDMNDIARKKYEAYKSEVEIRESYMQAVQFPEGSVDLVVCVNSLNNAPPVKPMLSKIARWIKPGGHLFLIDFGREINVVDWTWFLLRNLITNHGIAATIEHIKKTSRVIRINRNGQGDQRKGKLWTHSSEELHALVTQAGLEITQKKLCYRDYADLVVAKKM